MAARRWHEYDRVSVTCEIGVPNPKPRNNNPPWMANQNGLFSVWEKGVLGSGQRWNKIEA